MSQLYETVAGLPDLVRLVHGNSRSIQKLVREFCEFWRRKDLPDATADDAASDENAPVVKVSKRKAEAKIREIAVYEYRPQSYKKKLWYVNDKTIEKLSLNLPVPTEWKWITLPSAKNLEANTAGSAKQSVGVNSVPPSPSTANGTIKSFISSMTPNGSRRPSPTGNGVDATKASCGGGQLPIEGLQQSPSVSTSKAESFSSMSPVCTSVVCDNGAAASVKQNPVRPASTPCSSSSAKKRKIQSVRRGSLPLKQQPCLLFTKKPRQPAHDNDCMVVDSCIVKPNATKPCDTISNIKPSDDDDCMIVDTCVLKSECGNKPNAVKECSELREDIVGSASDIAKISDEKSLPETDANCNVCVDSSSDTTNQAMGVDD